MARTIGATVDLLLLRARQSGGIAITNNDATQILTICQQIVNIALRRLTVSESFTTLKQKQVYSISELTTAIDIVSVSESNRELLEIKDIRDFSAYENNWFRNITGSRFEAWHQIGRDYFIIYPAKAANSSVTIESVKATTLSSDYVADGASNLELPDEDIEIVLKMAEAILLVRSRNATPLQMTTASLIDLLRSKNVVLKS